MGPKPPMLTRNSGSAAFRPLETCSRQPYPRSLVQEQRSGIGDSRNQAESRDGLEPVIEHSSQGLFVRQIDALLPDRYRGASGWAREVFQSLRSSIA
jgi:hypothetical protein